MQVQVLVAIVGRLWLVAAGQVGHSYQAEFRTDRARVRVAIRSNDYLYEVTNLHDSPIVRFEVPQHVAYFFEAPAGWEKKTTAGVFTSSAGKPALGIRRGETKSFSFRVSSQGAAVGRGPARLEFRSGETAEVPGVLAPVPEPASHIAMVAALGLGILVLHAAVLTWRDRRGEAAGVNGV